MDATVIEQLKQELELLKPREDKAYDEYKAAEKAHESELKAIKASEESVRNKFNAARDAWYSIYRRREAVELLSQTAETMTASAEAKE